MPAPDPTQPDTREIRKVIAQRHDITAEALDALMVELDLDIAEYLSDHFGFGAAESAEFAAFKAWAPEAKKRLDQFEEWLSTMPFVRYGTSGPLEDLTHERDDVMKAVVSFRGWVSYHYDPARGQPKGRRVDSPRVFLEEAIGTSLSAAGIWLTTAPDGTFAKVLEAVYETVGIPMSKKMEQSAGAVRRAITRHPEWRDARIIGYKKER